MISTVVENLITFSISPRPLQFKSKDKSYASNTKVGHAEK
jgi:hypothetical protein